MTKPVAMKLFSAIMVLVLVTSFSTALSPAGPVLAVPAAAALAGNSDPDGTSENLLQFTSGGHVLGFDSDGAIIASADHMLKIQFIGSSGAAPKADTVATAGTNNSTASPLSRVTYQDVWDGVTVIYQAAPGAIAESSYYIEATEDGIPYDAIKLGYNRPVALDEQGNLVIAYDNGEIVESAPVAWQEIDGLRKPVTASFDINGEREVGFCLSGYTPGVPVVIDPEIRWNTFLGGTGIDRGYAIAIDGSNNVYVTGYSTATWGSPVRNYQGSEDAFAAELDGDGNLIWNTFLGSGGVDEGNGIAVDGSGNVYVTGYSSSSWGTPVRNYTSDLDAFVAELDGSGNLTWNTFLGGSGVDYGRAITLDGSGNICVAGESSATWQGDDPPVRAYTANKDAFVAGLDGSGNLTWNTFLGGDGDDSGYGIAVDSSGNIYIAGYSNATWGSPVRGYTADYDAFAAELDSSDNLTWNIFLGGIEADVGYGITLDGSNNIYVTGDSSDTWGSPVRNYEGSNDAFVACVINSDNLSWNTFLGSTATDGGRGIAVDGAGNIYVAGFSYDTWGSPVIDYTALSDGFAAKLDSSGGITWNGFLGGDGDDFGYGVAVDNSENVFVAGYSTATWQGDNPPVRAYTASTNDAFAAEISKILPTVTTDATTGITTDSATLHLSYTEGDFHPVDVEFAYKRSIDSTWTETGFVSDPTSPYTFPLSGLTSNTQYDFKAQLRYDTTTIEGSTLQFTTLKILPTVTTSAATGVATYWATLNLSYTPGDYSPINVRFAYKRNVDAVWTYTSWQTNPSLTYSELVSSLNSNTLYDFMAQLEYDSTTINGDPLQFTTLKIPPTVTTNAATGIGTNSATLNLSYTPGDYTTIDVRFAYKRAIDPGWTYTSWQTNPSLTYSELVSSLNSNTLYDFMAQLRYDSTIIDGATLQFTTTKAVPTVTTTAATGITTDSANLNMTYTQGDYAPVDVQFAYKRSIDSTWTETGFVSDPTSPYTFPLSGLTSNTQYDFKAQLRYDTTTIEGSTLQFTTLKILPTVTTSAATGVATYWATLNLSYTPGDYSPINVRFAYKRAVDTTWTYTTFAYKPGSPYATTIYNLASDTTYDFMAQLRYDSNIMDGTTLQFTTERALPTVNTNAATGVNIDSATLNLTYTPGDYSPVDVRFAYKRAADPGWTYTAFVTDPGSPYSVLLSGLDLDTTYDFRAELQYDSTVIEGTVRQFTTAKVLPTVTTNNATGITTDSATLNMSYALGDYTTVDVRFAYRRAGDSTWTYTPWQTDPGSPYSILISALTAATEYDFKAQLRYDSTILQGATNQFTTEGTATTTQPSPPAKPKASPSTQPPAYLRQANVHLQSISVNPGQAQAGQPVTVRANVVNDGVSSGSYNVALWINGQMERQRTVEVSPGAAYPVEFTVTRTEPGNYDVDIEGQKASFTILHAGAGKPGNISLLASISTTVVIVLAALVLMIRLRRPARLARVWNAVARSFRRRNDILD